MQRKLGEQTQEAQEKLQNLSLSGWEEAGDDRGYEEPQEKKKQDKTEHKQREREIEAGESREAPVQQTELMVEEKSAGTTAVGDLFEAVGAAVIGAAQSAKELVMGRQPEVRKE